MKLKLIAGLLLSVSSLGFSIGGGSSSDICREGQSRENYNCSAKGFKIVNGSSETVYGSGSNDIYQEFAERRAIEACERNGGISCTITSCYTLPNCTEPNN